VTPVDLVPSLAGGDTAEAQRDVSICLSELGKVAMGAGDLARAKAQFEESLTILRKLAKDNPRSAEAQRDVGVSITALGDVAVQAGAQAGARARFEEGVAIARKLAKDNPSSAVAQRDLLISLVELGQVVRDRALVNEALRIARDLERTGRLAPRDHGLPEWVTGIRDSFP
jgi:Flp pilus assembly protein TadD